MKRVCFLTVCGMALMAAKGAWAQDTEVVTVNAYRAAQSIGAATKTDTPLIETPQSVSVVTREEMDARGVENLNEAVRYNAGVLQEGTGIDNRVDDFFIRGFEAGSWGDNVTLDGMRAPQGSQWNRSMFDTWNLERVEVLKGPSAVLYGQVAPGGMVNQVSKAPRADQRQQFQLGIDGFGAGEAAFDVGGNMDEFIDGADPQWRLVGRYVNGPTQIDHTSRQHWFLAPSVTAWNDGANRLTLLGLYQQDNGGSTFQFLPYQGAAVPTRYGYIQNDTFLGEPDWNTYDRTVANLGWLYEHRFNSDWKINQNARYTHVDSLYRTTVAGTTTLTADRLLGRRAVQGTGNSEGFTLDTRLEGKLRTGAFDHTVLAGFDFQDATWDGLRQAARVAPAAIAIDVYNPVYTHFDFAPTLFDQISSKGHNSQSGIYLQDQIAVDKWRFTLSGRHDWFDNRELDRLANVRNDVDASASTGRAGILYLFDFGLAPYASYAESFQPSTYTAADNFAGTPFDPTSGVQWEAGLKYEPKWIEGMITLSAYDLRQNNVATTDPDATHDCGTGPGSCYVQTGQVRVRGLELEGRVTPVSGFSIIGAASRMNSEITRANDATLGKRMAGVPNWMGSLWLDYTFQQDILSGLSLAGGTRFVGQTYGNTLNTLPVKSYALWDAALRYDLNKVGFANTQISVNASNLADKRYVATCSAPTACFYGSGRTVTVKLKYAY